MLTFPNGTIADLDAYSLSLKAHTPVNPRTPVVSGTQSKADAVPAVVRDRGVGGGAGAPGVVFFVVVESSTEESAGKLSLGPRESGMVSTRRSAVSPESLEVELCAVIPRGRRTPNTADDTKYESVCLAGSLPIRFLRRDRCVYRETTADDNIKPR